MNPQDFKNLELIFTLARQATVNNEPELVNVINFKLQLFEKLKAAFPEKKEEEKVPGTAPSSL